MKSTPVLLAAALAISGCGAAIPPDAPPPPGRPDASSPSLPDGGGGDQDGGTSFQGEITYTETGYDLLAVDSTGTAYAVNLSGSGAEIWSGNDGRAWQKRGSIASGASFWNLAPLADGTLLADVIKGAGHALARSTDGGASWTAVVAGSQDGDLVDAALLPDGSLLCGQDISYRGSTPDKPQIARIAPDGTVTHLMTLPSASYSTHAVRSGGYMVGTTY